jgi:CMP-N-acetylneuraminic acid synthetase
VIESEEVFEVLCVIPARGGSKGLPNKNILNLDGSPLISHAIRYALESKFITDIVVSTDSEDIANVALSHGAQVPFIRPKELSDDLSTTESVLTHALKEMESIKKKTYDYCVFLTGTSVIRPSGLIDRGIDYLNNHPIIESYFSGYKTTKNYWKVDSHGNWERLLSWMKVYSSRQVRENIVREDTGIASISRANIWRSGRRIGDKVFIEITEDDFTSLDIHTAEDLELAECAIRIRRQNEKS